MHATPDPHSTRYFAWLYSHGPQRLALHALFGVEREVTESLRPGLDHHVAHSRLQWWREECERTANGHAVHPLTRELTAAFDGTHQLTQSIGPSLPQLAGLTGFVDTAVWDLAGATFETRRELTAYCQRWAAAMIEPVVSLGGQALPTSAGEASLASVGAALNPAASVTPHNWRSLGAALRELEMVTDLAREAHSGRLRIPLDELEATGADPAVLVKPPWPDAVAELLRNRHQALRGSVSRIVGDLDGERKSAMRGLLVWAALSWRASWRAEQALPDFLRPRKVDAIADAWFAWRAARQATIGRSGWIDRTQVGVNSR